MSFNYTPPPAEITRVGEIATYALYATLLFVPKVPVGAAIGGLGSGIITYWVCSHATGDLGGLSALINPPIWAVIGALFGAGISFVSQTIWRFLRGYRLPAKPKDSV